MISVEYNASEELYNAITTGLQAANAPYLGNEKTKHFVVTVKDENGKIVGGIIAWMRTGMGLLFIDTLWVSDDYRKKGYGKSLMQAAEEEGKKQGCTHSQLETTSFQDESFYQKLGYFRVGVVEKFYGNHDAIYMRKIIA